MKKLVLATLFASSLAYAGTPIESDAVISEQMNSELISAVADVVKAFGYRCDSVSSARPLVWEEGFAIVCNNYRYTYEIRDVGGNWKVFVK
jgi:hypothetical protein